MTNPQLTWIVFLLDRSGSMQSIKADTEGGFAAFIEEQRTAPGQCAVTLAQFDTDYDVVYSGLPVTEVPPLNLQPRGATALLDSMGRLITETGQKLAAMPESERPGNVVVAIMTDGMENSSREWTHAAIKSLVEQQTNVYGWQFLYMGADQDAIEVGASIGVRPDYAVNYSRANVESVMAATSANLSANRAARMVDPSAPMPGYSPAQRNASGR
ncbi:VWA domain-containing protein [Skermania sp. ID1734]|uniref:vWA domain-containing protein n=1 Tax=Skermania sp. ID1734 TaxID=2597516 RepID=UPI00117CEAD7|nr:vWA domain-containing protein [Skermania sp. ID1734]TSD93952.1 VWA domain-containing protein [Skermania sp. ID1734]